MLIEAFEVDTGIALLNEIKPGWNKLVKLKSFKLRDNENCVVCQVKGIKNYAIAIASLRLDSCNRKIDGSKNGFACPDRMSLSYVSGSDRDEWWADAERRWRAEVERLNALDAAAS